MLLYRYRIIIVAAFMTIFAAKMVVSAAPLFMCMDKCSIKPMILDLEQEHGSEGDSKNLLKYTDYRYTDIHYSYIYVPVSLEHGIRNCYIDHSKRYVNPYHPSVPTPPPNAAAISAISI